MSSLPDRDDAGLVALAAQLRPVLLDLARRRATLTYRDLVAAAVVQPPHTIHRTTLALELLIQQDHEAGQPLLAAGVLSRGPDGIPGRGFFQLLTQLGRYQGPDRGAEAIAAHRAELEALWGYWEARPERS